jgi:glutathione S-transferase
MALTALVTLLLLFQYLAFLVLTGVERGRRRIEAPAVTGDPVFERTYRVQVNTLEQLVLMLPAMWLTALFFPFPVVAPVLGVGFFIGRALYRRSYLADPASRGPGLVLGMVCIVAALACATWGVATRL